MTVETLLALVMIVPLLFGVIEFGWLFQRWLAAETVAAHAARITTAADLATLAAVDDQDGAALIDSGALRLAPDASLVARDFFARNLAAIAPHLAVTPEAAAAAADVASFPTAPAVDPLTGWRYDRPAVRIAASVPVRAPALGLFLVPTTTAITVRAASSPR